MLNLYAFATPNSIKAVIALEEISAPYHLHAVNVRAGEQKMSRFLALNPNGKIPVLVDDSATEGEFVLTESAAILVHLAERYGKLLPTSSPERARVFEQLFFHASGLSPAFGQSGYFQKLAPEPAPHAVQRFHGEAMRTARLLDSLLARHEFVAGNTYTIADIAHFGWLWRRAFANVDLAEMPNLARWYDTMSQRPAVIRAMNAVESLIPVQQ
ncbi:glutathione S-transferase family protein [Dyella psychrodurans]|uniref:Glutathione S-transferase family protein n=2 Tax=Dyella psychrodurans TaxID=1927960 RepID=A0A370XEN2_9GAMM|nr:glutathione S-transferase family protein [Dyella psychrodurans]